MSYLNKNFLEKINRNNISNILELGSRDGKETLEINQYFQPDLFFVFEANPYSFKIAENNVSSYGNIKIIQKAVGAQDGIINFYPFPENEIGPCSVFLNAPNCKTWGEARKHAIQGSKQDPDNPVKVECIRLDNFLNKHKVEKIDLICADIQGSEMNAFIGLGDFLKNVKYIICEIPVDESVYLGAPSRDELLFFLKENGFYLSYSFAENDIEENGLFINEAI